VSPERKPGDPGWKPSDEDIRAAQAPRPRFALRVFSVLPFILFGAFSVIAFVSRIAVVSDCRPGRNRQGHGLPPHLGPHEHSGGSVPFDNSVG
jgi:hypothetical protein